MPSPRTRRRLTALAAGVALLALAACRGEEAPPVADLDTGAAAPSLPRRFATAEVSGEAEGFGLLRSVEVSPAAGGEGVERVVFEFEAFLPGVMAGYVDGPVVQDGSGDEVAVEGGAVLALRFDPASGADLSGSELRVVYDGPDRIDPPTSTVVEVVRVGDFEGILHWAVGLSGKVPFRLRALEEPSRLVLEVRPRS